MRDRTEVLAHATPKALLIFGMGAAAVPASVVATFWGRGSIEQFSWLFLPAILLGPLCAIASLLIGLLSVRSGLERVRERLRWASAALLGLFAIAAVLAPSYLAGRVLNYRDVRAARSYCMMLVPRVEAYKEKEGAYPAHVGELLPTFREVPRLLPADGSFYRTVGARFEFFFTDPSGWESGHYYFSDDAAPRGRWETWD
jgi:hypothetical protein